MAANAATPLAGPTVSSPLDPKLTADSGVSAVTVSPLSGATITSSAMSALLRPPVVTALAVCMFECIFAAGEYVSSRIDECACNRFWGPWVCLFGVVMRLA